MLLVCFTIFIFIRQIYMIFIGLMSFLVASKSPVLLLNSFLSMLIGFLNKFLGFVKQILLKTIITRWPIYIIVLMLISYSHLYIANCSNNLCSNNCSVSVNNNISGPSLNILHENFSFCNSSRLPYEV